MSGSYFFYDFILEKCGHFWKNGRFSGRIWPDWGNTARADMAGLGSIGLRNTVVIVYFKSQRFMFFGFVTYCFPPIKLCVFIKVYSHSWNRC